MLNRFLCDRTHSAKHFIIISRLPTPIACSFVFMSLKLLIKKKEFRIEGEYMNIQLNIHSVNERINKENRWSIFISLALKYIFFFDFRMSASSLHILRELLHLLIVPRMAFYFWNAVFCSFDTFDIKYPKEIKIISLSMRIWTLIVLSFIVHRTFLMYSWRLACL